MTDMRFGQDCDWQPIGIQRHAFDIRCLSACLGDWGCRRNYNTAHMPGVYVYCLMCTWCSYGKRRLRGSPFISSLITVPTGRPHRGVFQMQTRSLYLHTTHTQPLYSIPTSVAAHNTHNLAGCLSGRPDSGQLIFSSIDRLINTKTPHYSVFF